MERLILKTSGQPAQAEVVNGPGLVTGRGGHLGPSLVVWRRAKNGRFAWNDKRISTYGLAAGLRRALA